MAGRVAESVEGAEDRCEYISQPSESEAEERDRCVRAQAPSPPASSSQTPSEGRGSPQPDGSDFVSEEGQPDEPREDGNESDVSGSREVEVDEEEEEGSEEGSDVEWEDVDIGNGTDSSDSTLSESGDDWSSDEMDDITELSEVFSALVLDPESVAMSTEVDGDLMMVDWVATGCELQVGSSCSASTDDWAMFTSPPSEDVDMDVGQAGCLPEPSLQGVPEEPMVAPEAWGSPTQFGPVDEPLTAARTREQAEEGINYLLRLAMHHPHLWEILVGMYFQEGRNPRTYLGCNQDAQGSLSVDWEPDLLMQDMRGRDPAMCPAPYTMPSGEDGQLLQSTAATILDGNEDLFLAAIKKWQLELVAHRPCALDDILQRAGWCRSAAELPEWKVIAGLKRLADGPGKEAQLQHAVQQLPRFFMRCYNDPSCCDARNPRRPPEESGPFGKRRNTRYSSTRSGTRTGTPAKRENPNVAEFGRLFNLQQEEQGRQRNTHPSSNNSNPADNNRAPPEQPAVECILYGYRDKASEWKVIDKFERISQGYICEDYPRTDPETAPRYPQLLSGGDVIIRHSLSADANKKSKRYAGGSHWIKVTFDSPASADKACFFSPHEIDGYLVHCELYHGQGPQHDAPIPKNSLEASRMKDKFNTFSQSTTAPLIDLDDVDHSTLPRTFTMNPPRPSDDPFLDDDGAASLLSTATLSSATVTGQGHDANNTTLRHRQPLSQLQPQNQPQTETTTQQEVQSQSEYMTHIPTVRRAVLRPTSEALPPQPSVSERVLRSIPILSWFTGDIVGDGPALREDGSFDYDKSNIYWRFWHMVDQILGTDLCGLNEES